MVDNWRGWYSNTRKYEEGNGRLSSGRIRSSDRVNLIFVDGAGMTGAGPGTDLRNFSLAHPSSPTPSTLSPTLLSKIAHYGALLQARNGPQAGRGARLRRTDPCCPPITHRNVLFQTIPLDASGLAGTHHAPIYRALCRTPKRPHCEGGPHAIQEHRPEHERGVY